MKKIVISALLLTALPMISFADYVVKGFAHFIQFNPQTKVVSWTCDEGEVVCFTHNGNATSPGSGQRIKLQVGDGWYDIQLVSASGTVPTSDPTVFKEGTYVGELK